MKQFKSIVGIMVMLSVSYISYGSARELHLRDFHKSELDVNGDGFSDHCVRQSTGIVCRLGSINGFGPRQQWDRMFSDYPGYWNAPFTGETVQFPDVNGDGLSDVCGRASNGVWCSISNGREFVGFRAWSMNFTNAQEWNRPSFADTIRFPDVNGDSLPDLCGRAASGIVCEINNGHGFGGFANWSKVFTNAQGWTLPINAQSIHYRDVNGDGLDDVCARPVNRPPFCLLSDGRRFLDF